MNPLPKKIIAITLSLFILCLMYFGSYLPLRKSRLLIEAIRGVGAAKTVNDFEESVSRALDFYSPAGQSESVRQMGHIVLNVLASQKDLPKPVADELLNFITKYFEAIIQPKHGGNLSQIFLVSGSLYQVVGSRLGDNAYLEKAIDYYKRGLNDSPKRPEFLYNLFNIYLTQKDFTSAKNIGEQILQYWPNDEIIKEKMEKL